MGCKESPFTARICQELRDLGALVYVLPGTSTSSGLPDRLVVHKRLGGGVLLEFKGVGGSLRENQRLTLRACNERGMRAFVVCDLGNDQLGLLNADKDERMSLLKTSVKADGDGLLRVLTFCLSNGWYQT